jgi:hypothetical protein
MLKNVIKELSADKMKVLLSEQASTGTYSAVDCKRDRSIHLELGDHAELALHA